MISWGVEVNDYGNAILDEAGGFKKVSSRGASDALWAEMIAYADANGWKGGNFKKLNLPFENKLLGQPYDIRERMIQDVEEFAYNMMANVLNAGDTASLVVESILASGTHDPGPKAQRIEPPEEWTAEKIAARAALFSTDKGPAGDFDD
jgi:hypothetical protein